jgi:hypothetical protein
MFFVKKKRGFILASTLGENSWEKDGHIVFEKVHYRTWLKIIKFMKQ